jgi:hypothetical protein
MNIFLEDHGSHPTTEREGISAQKNNDTSREAVGVGVRSETIEWVQYKHSRNEEMSRMQSDSLSIDDILEKF